MECSRHFTLNSSPQPTGLAGWGTLKTRIPPPEREAKSSLFVPPGTPDNSPPLKRWDNKSLVATAPIGATEFRTVTSLQLSRELEVRTCLPSLAGLVGRWHCSPTVETVGYFRLSLAGQGEVSRRDTLTLEAMDWPQSFRWPIAIQMLTGWKPIPCPTFSGCSTQRRHYFSNLTVISPELSPNSAHASRQRKKSFPSTGAVNVPSSPSSIGSLSS